MGKYEAPTHNVNCSCEKYTNFVGILCAHALKVLDKKNVKKIPPQYILKRWTREARVVSISSAMMAMRFVVVLKSQLVLLFPTSLVEIEYL